MVISSESLPVTEILYLDIDPAKSLKDGNLDARSLWAGILSLSANSGYGFQDQYWGRGLTPELFISTIEEPSKVRLHIVRDTLSEHSAFHSSTSGESFRTLLNQVIMPGTDIKIRHALLQDFVVSNGCRAVQAPVTGSAFYRDSTDAFADYAWPLWTTIVGRTSGVRGVSGGRVLASEGENEGYLVYVGWDNYDSHQKFRKSQLCSERRIVLTEGNSGQVEYYHLAFENAKYETGKYGEGEHWKLARTSRGGNSRAYPLVIPPRHDTLLSLSQIHLITRDLILQYVQ